VDTQAVIEQCEDHLFPRLNFTVRERSLYYHLLRHTRLISREQHIFALAPLAQALGVSDWSVRADFRTLHSRHCIEIVERSQAGHLVRVFLPTEIDGALPSDAPKEPVNMDALDFFSGRRFVRALMEREGNSCFYCMRAVRVDTCALDHVIPQVSRVDSSYRNVVVACHDCNS
jgi:HNH endonuclease